MFFNPSTVVAVLGLVSVVPAFAAPIDSSLPSIRRSLASKLERRAAKVQRQKADPQTSLTLDPSQVASGLAQNGQAGGGDPGQVASLTSTNNYINFCLTQSGVPLTNGQQVKTGSCNAVPMGRIIGSDKMPSAKFVNPKNGDTVAANTAFTIQMAISNMVTGNFVNPTTNYYSAPQQVDGSGTVIGHSHVTVELLSSLAQTTVTNPNTFAFFKGLNDAAANGVLSTAVTAGLPAGAYRLCSINSAANHQPVLVAVAQRGSTDDCVYFTSAAGGATGGNTGNAGNTTGNAGNTGNTGNTGNAGNTGNTGNTGNAGGNTGNAGKTGGGRGGKGGNNAAAVSTSAAAAASSTVPAASSAAPVVSASVAPASTSAAAPASTFAAAAGGAGGNFQTFTGTLGGAPPPVTAGGKGFLINGDSFINKAGAIQRSCDVQKNACATAANSSGNKAPLTVAACETQEQACTAAVSA